MSYDLINHISLRPFQRIIYIFCNDLAKFYTIIRYDILCYIASHFLGFILTSVFYALFFIYLNLKSLIYSLLRFPFIQLFFLSIQYVFFLLLFILFISLTFNHLYETFMIFFSVKRYIYEFVKFITLQFYMAAKSFKIWKSR